MSDQVCCQYESVEQKAACSGRRGARRRQQHPQYRPHDGRCKEHLLANLGTACEAYQDKALRNLACERIQCDEIWSFCYAKEKNVPDELKGKFGFGDVWTWTSICADTKLVPCWFVEERTIECAENFMNDLASRLSHRVQLTTDRNQAYINAIDGAFGIDVDYATLIKAVWRFVIKKMRRSGVALLSAAEPERRTGRASQTKSMSQPVMSNVRT